MKKYLDRGRLGRWSVALTESDARYPSAELNNAWAVKVVQQP